MPPFVSANLSTSSCLPSPPGEERDIQKGVIQQGGSSKKLVGRWGGVIKEEGGWVKGDTQIGQAKPYKGNMTTKQNNIKRTIENLLPLIFWRLLDLKGSHCCDIMKRLSGSYGSKVKSIRCRW